jgi:hypothetical protein
VHFLVATGSNSQSLTIIDDGAATGTYSSSNITISGESALSTLQFTTLF